MLIKSPVCYVLGFQYNSETKYMKERRYALLYTLMSFNVFLNLMFLASVTIFAFYVIHYCMTIYENLCIQDLQLTAK